MRGGKEPEARSYRQFCGLARALDVVGERWTLLIVRNLLLGPRRYGDLLDELPGITTNLLAKRLRDLGARGLVRKVTLPPPISAVAYDLTEAGAALEPVVMELARWGGRYMDAPREGDAVNVGWGLLSLKRRYRGGLDLTVELRIDGRVFTLRLEPARLDVKERAADRPDVVVEGGLAAVRALFFERGGPKLKELRAEGAVAATGEAKDVAAFAAAFAPLPPLPTGGSRAR